MQADGINEEFLKNLFTETIYLVEGEYAAPATPAPEPLKEFLPVKTEGKIADVKEEVSEGIRNQITDHKPLTTPVIPHLPKKPAPAKYKVTGTNDKGVVILVTLPDEEFMRLPQLSFLQKILEAIGLKPADVAYVNNISGATAQFENLEQELQIRYIVSFASRLDTSLPHDKFTLYHPIVVGDVPVVFSQSLAILENDVEQKKLLWNALRQVFL